MYEFFLFSHFLNILKNFRLSKKKMFIKVVDLKEIHVFIRSLYDFFLIQPFF